MDVLLVVVESLSAVDSARTSGLSHRLPRFDELSLRGTLFRNFVANNEASEGGLIAMLSGVPPLHYPTASTQPFEEYAVQPTMVDVFRRAGYFTEFVTSVPLRFLSMKAYVSSPTTGFASAAGQDECIHDRFRPTGRPSRVLLLHRPGDDRAVHLLAPRGQIPDLCLAVRGDGLWAASLALDDAPGNERTDGHQQRTCPRPCAPPARPGSIASCPQPIDR